MPESEIARRRTLLLNLKRAGLRKVFLGVESGNDAQIRRYGKSHKREEVIRVIDTLRCLGISFDIGWIMFDPLCTVSELEDNASLLRQANVAQHASSLFSEIRIQTQSKYLRIVKNVERRIKMNILDPHLDPNTLSYSYKYVYPEVAQIVRVVRRWSDVLSRVHYPIKNLSRFGVTGPLGPATLAANDQLALLRTRLLDCFESLTSSGMSATSDKLFQDAVGEFRVKLLDLISSLDSASRSHPRIVFARDQLSREYALNQT
jgi:hypothetical protein